MQSLVSSPAFLLSRPSLAPRSPTPATTPPAPIQNMQIFYNPAIKLFGVFYGASCAEQNNNHDKTGANKKKKRRRVKGQLEWERRVES